MDDHQSDVPRSPRRRIRRQRSSWFTTIDNHIPAYIITLSSSQKRKKSCSSHQSCKRVVKFNLKFMELKIARIYLHLYLGAILDLQNGLQEASVSKKMASVPAICTETTRTKPWSLQMPRAAGRSNCCCYAYCVSNQHGHGLCVTIQVCIEMGFCWRLRKQGKYQVV